MDLFTSLLVIFILIIFSFGSYILFSKLPRGKTFEEALAEKKQLAEKIYALSAGHEKKKTNKNKKINNNKKQGKPSTKLNKKESELDTPEESDVNSDANPSNDSPVHHVEFSEAEIISDSEPKKTKTNQQTKKKNSKTVGAGILINKSEPVIVKSEPIIETLNHFETIHPKDDMEKWKSSQKEESTAKADKNNKEQKKGKLSKKEIDSFTPPRSISPAVVVPTKEQNKQQIDEKIIVAAVAPIPTKQENLPIKEKANRKKKNELDLVKMMAEGISVNYLIQKLDQAEFTRSEIQILIDYLLNKQQDTITVEHSEWSESKTDVLQKLKKQLAEKEKALQDEQEASIAVHAKLRELRTEFNLERAQFNANIKAQIEEISSKKSEIQNILAEKQFVTDKLTAEKQTLTVQIQQIQSKFIQMKDNEQNSQDALQQIQQITESNQILQNELSAKNSIIKELNDYQNFAKDEKFDLEKKLGDYENLIRQKDEQTMFLEKELNSFRQRVQEFAVFESDNQRLRSDIEKLYTRHQYETEQLKIKLTEQQKSVHLDETNKVEMRNLQNALDSSRAELNSNRNETNDNKNTINELQAQIKELKSNICNFNQQSEEQSKQVNELSVIVTNYKTALTDKEIKLEAYEREMNASRNKEDDLFKQIEEHKGRNNHHEVNAKQVIQEEQNRTKQLFQKILPDLPPGPVQYDEWLEHLGNYFNNKINVLNHNSLSNNINSNSSQTTNNIADSAIEQQNLKLQKSLDSCKIVMAETDKILKNLEKKSEEQETYWQRIVESKDAEIDSLKLRSQTT